MDWLLLLFDKYNFLKKKLVDYNFFVVICNMPAMLTISMKKRMEHVLQESVEMGHVNNTKWLE